LQDFDEDFAGGIGTPAALRRDAELPGEIAQRSSARFDALADLFVGDAVAKTDIHDRSS
jgi:hypothetical protein